MAEAAMARPARTASRTIQDRGIMMGTLFEFRFPMNVHARKAGSESDLFEKVDHMGLALFDDADLLPEILVFFEKGLQAVLLR